MIRSGAGRWWAHLSRPQLSGLIALGYYSLAITTLLIEYVSESDKLSRGTFTDTFNPLVIAELVTWPSSSFVSTWSGYPEPFSQPVWQQALNDSMPSHVWAAVVQTLLVFLLVLVLGTVSRRTRSRPDKANRARS